MKRLLAASLVAVSAVATLGLGIRRHLRDWRALRCVAFGLASGVTAGLLTPATAIAAAFTSVQIQTVSVVGTNHDGDNFIGMTPGSAYDSSSAVDAGFLFSDGLAVFSSTDSSLSQGRGSANYGSNKLHAATALSHATLRDDYLGNHVSFSRDVGISSIVDSIAQWSDTITIDVSPTLPYNSPVEIQLGLYLHGVLSAIGDPCGGSLLSVPESGMYSYISAGLVGGFIALDQTACDGMGERVQIVRTQVTANVGVPFQVAGVLEIISSVHFSVGALESIPTSVFSSTTVDADSTSEFFLTVLAEGATYSTESGTIYSDSAPLLASEPAALSVLSLGLAALLLRRRRSHLRQGEFV